ncbi:MAG TPA: hypothetical protein PKE40_03495 [Arachnia sp.]|nr:hypothetical protein [Arachnia sp.]HMT85394.1 hypothetical protein [Arachnia sp.]
MPASQKTNTAHPAKTPQAAAIAGIAFAILFALGVILIRLGADGLSTGEFTGTTEWQLTLAMTLMPFSGIAFLWFLGVVRNHLGTHEDQFFATVTLGSGLLFVAMSFVAFSVAAAMMTTYASGQSNGNTYALGRAIIDQAFNIYALKMAGVFMSSLGTLWQKTGVMPKPLALGTYILSVIMLISISHNLWLTLLFPTWVLIVSGFILVSGLRIRNARDAPSTEDPSSD